MQDRHPQPCHTCRALRAFPSSAGRAGAAQKEQEAILAGLGSSRAGQEQGQLLPCPALCGTALPPQPQRCQVLHHPPACPQSSALRGETAGQEVTGPCCDKQEQPSGIPGSQPCAFTLSHTSWAGLFLTVNKAHKINLITFFVSD